MQKFIAKLIEAEWDQKQSSKGILQKGALRNFAKFSWKRLFSCELFKIYKNTFLQNASRWLGKRDPDTGIFLWIW